MPAQTRESCTRPAERLEERVSQLVLYLEDTSVFAPKQAAASQNQVAEKANYFEAPLENKISYVLDDYLLVDARQLARRITRLHNLARVLPASAQVNQKPANASRSSNEQRHATQPTEGKNER